LDQIGATAAADVLAAVIRKAREGDAYCARLILQRCWPPRKARVPFPMPTLATTDDLPRALAAVVEAIASGTLSPDEASAIATVLQAQMRAVELIELDHRMKEIERRLTDATETED
jgi:hypothetical protein